MTHQYDTKTGRAYVHEKCGTETVVSGECFVGLCNPFKPCIGTICVECDLDFPVKQFIWTDTGECIRDYRKRMRREAPRQLKLWHYLYSPLIGAIAGAVAGVWIERDAMTDARAGAVIGAVVMYFVFGPRLTGIFGANRYYKKP